jgi:hypothetical protein
VIEPPTEVRWTSITDLRLAELLRTRQSVDTGSRMVIAIDGMSASGKTTLCSRVAHHIPASAVVHTDDVAWNHSFFGWETLLIEHVLQPFSAGLPVRFRPEAWIKHHREGVIEVTADTQVLLLEGVGAGRRELDQYVDSIVWVVADEACARERAMARDGDTPEANKFWDEWMRQEKPFLAHQRSWERATIISNGTPDDHAVPRELQVRLVSR